MKLSDLGLSTKPQDVYTDHLILKFKTVEGELFYKKVLHQNKKLLVKSQWIKVTDKDHYDMILKFKASEVQA